MAFLKGPLIGNRVKVSKGLDFNDCVFSGDYLEIKFRSGAFMGSNPGTTGEWEKGILVQETLDAGTYTTEWKGKYASAFTIDVETNNTYDGHTNGGALRVDFVRPTGYDHEGGSEDQAVKINATNYCTTSGGIRGLTIETTNRTGTTGKVQGALITAHQRTDGGFSGGLYGARIVSKNRQPSGGAGTQFQHALEVADESDGVQPSLNSILWIEKQSNSNTAATRAAIEIVNNALTSAARVITHGIYLKCGATNSNITNVIGFDSNDGTDGFTKLTGTPTQGGTIIGYIKLYNAADSATLYVPCYSQAPA